MRGRSRAALAAVLFAQALIVGVPLLSGSWYADDVFNAAVVARAPLTWTFVTRNFFGHLLPVSQLLLWVGGRSITHHAGVAAVELVAILLCTFLFHRVARLLAPGRPGPALLVTCVYVASPALLPSWLWWASAIELVPAHLAFLLAALATLRIAGGGGRRWYAVGWLAFGLGVCSWDLAQLAVVWLPLLFLAVGREGPRERLRAALAVWPLWTGVAAIEIGYQIAYQTGGFATPSVTSAGKLAALLGDSWVQGVAPGVVGGPVSWDHFGVGPFQLFSAPPALMAVAEVVAVLAIAVTVRRTRRTLWGWSLVAAGAVLPFVAVGLGRLSFSGPSFLARDPRYLSLSLVPVLLGLLIVWQEFSSATVTSTRETRVVAVATAATLVLALVSDVVYARPWSRLSTESWFSNAQGDLRAATRAGPVVLLDGHAPDGVLTSYFGAASNRLSFLLPTVIKHGVSYDGVAQHPDLLDPAGHLRQAVLFDRVPYDGKPVCVTDRDVSLPWVPPAPPVSVEARVIELTISSTAPSTVSMRLTHSSLPGARDFVDNRTYDAGSHVVPAGVQHVFLTADVPLGRVYVQLGSQGRTCLQSVASVYAGLPAS